uniref:Uncharacterized protein n=1 Tax=Arcella intermedia TaxID=1963864 RepID=A0A6B2LEQ2_9EUKA
MKLGSPYMLQHHLSKKENRKAINRPSKHEMQNTPLHMSAYMEDPKITQLLIEHKANLNALNEKGQTPLHIAASLGDERIVEVLLESRAAVDVPGGDPREPSPLSRAVRGGFEGIARMLIDHRADVNQAHQGLAPLHLAVEAGSLPLVRLLVQARANAGAESRGTSPLGLALKNRHQDIVKVLTKALESPPRDPPDLQPPPKKQKTSTTPRSRDSEEASDGVHTISLIDSLDSTSAISSSNIQPKHNSSSSSST